MPVLFEAALRALVVALAVGIGLSVFRVSNVAAQKIAWGLVLACAAAMPLAMRWQILPASLTVRVPATLLPAKANAAPVHVAGIPGALDAEPPGSAQTNFSAAPEPESSGGDRFPAPVIASNQVSADVEVRPEAMQPEQIKAQGAPSLQSHPLRDAAILFLQPGLLAVLLYMAVCATLLFRMVYGLAIAVRLWFSAEPFVAEPELQAEMDAAPRLRVRFSPAVSSPVTIGSGVLLPEDCLEWDAEKLRIVLAHERAHVRQGDFYLQLLAGLYTAAFWFSPLGWWLKRKLSDLGEAISDRAGLEEAASRTSYAQVLLEFAALPRPTVIGVAMARKSNLAQRMERFLDESSFRRAFTGSSRRVLLAVVLVPVALFAGAALVRVEAAQDQAAPPPAAVPVPAAAPSAPPPSADQAPAAPALAPPSPDSAPALAPPSPDAAPAPAAAPAPPPLGEIHDSADDRAEARAKERAEEQNDSTAATITNGKHLSTSVGRGYSYSYSSHGDSWALVSDPGSNVAFSGEWQDGTRDSIKKVRQLTSGKFLWFTHNGKSYFIDDAALVAQIQAMYKPMEELGRQQEILGKRQEELGRQQEEMGKRQEQASIPTPDISKEMARLNEAVAKLDAKKGSTVSQEELADLQSRIGEIQGRIGELQGKIAARQGDVGELQGKLGEQQGKLGEEQGRLGAEQGRIAAEADRIIKSIIDQSLRDGKARPVE